MLQTGLLGFDLPRVALRASRSQRQTLNAEPCLPRMLTVVDKETGALTEECPLQDKQAPPCSRGQHRRTGVRAHTKQGGSGGRREVSSLSINEQ